MVDFSTPPPGGDVNRGPVVLIVGWIECTVAFSFLRGRMYARFKINRGVGADDWAMVFSFVSCTSRRAFPNFTRMVPTRRTDLGTSVRL